MESVGGGEMEYMRRFSREARDRDVEEGKGLIDASFGIFYVSFYTRSFNFSEFVYFYRAVYTVCLFLHFYCYTLNS